MIRRLRRPTAFAAAAFALTGAVGGVPLPAAASPGHPAVAVPLDPLDSAKARATQLRERLDALEIKAARAIEEYNATQERLGTVVTQHILAQRQLDEAKSEAAGAAETQAATLRAIYRAGGTTALYLTILDGTDPADVLTRVHALESIVGEDGAAVTAARDVSTRAATIERRLAELAAKQTTLEVQVAKSTDRVQSALRESRTLLAAADAEVRRLAAAQASAIDSATADDAARTLDAARAAAVPGGAGDVRAPNVKVAAAAIAAGKREIGDPYQWGATGPSSFDCSGLTGWAYRHAGVSLPRTSREQWYAGPHPGLGYLEPGDLLFWATDTSNPATIHHVAIYLGGHSMLAAPHTGTNVQIQPVYLNGYIGAVRPTG